MNHFHFSVPFLYNPVYATVEKSVTILSLVFDQKLKHQLNLVSKDFIKKFQSQLVRESCEVRYYNEIRKVSLRQVCTSVCKILLLEQQE